jgi:cyclopropane fatty-acyl-phospholipid synthase-like methyltransferase
VTSSVHQQVREYYESKLKVHGVSPAGVDWNSQASQELRFERLAALWDSQADASLLDFGCGYGAMLHWLRHRGFTGSYTGYDLSPEMIRAAEEIAGATQATGSTFTSNRASLAPVDFVVASGVFNVKMNTPEHEWHEYILTTLDDMATLGQRGFAFNALTSYSDISRRRADLYYADPRELFDYCKRRYSRFVALLHDYPLYEFTLLVTNQ